jgi:hypothetical protein
LGLAQAALSEEIEGGQVLLKRFTRGRVAPGLALVLALVLLAGGTSSNAASTTASATDPIFTVAGTGTGGLAGDGGPAIDAQIDQPRNLWPTADGGYVFAEPFNNTARRVAVDGTITRLAGTGTAGFSGDGGPATAAQLNFVHAAAATADGGFVLADELNNRIRKVLPNGTIITVAGNGNQGFGGDGGPATSASINNPRGVAATPDGGILIPDSNNHRVRLVAPDGTISTVAGTGAQGFSGDGGPATSAQLSIPFAVTPMPDGGFLVVDVGNQRIRRVAPDGTITTVAGNGDAGSSGDGGPATDAQLNNPHNVWPTADGGFLIADVANNRIRKVDSTGTISTFAGTGAQGFSGDGGPANEAQINFPKAVTELSSGTVLVSDTSNNRVRAVGPPSAPVALSSPGINGAPQSGQTLTASPGRWTAVPPPTRTYQWQRCDASGVACTDIAFATSTTYLVGGSDIGATIRVVETATNVAGATSAASSATSVVTEAASPPENTSPPTISGTAQDGATLTASPGSWSGTEPISYAYQWQRCNSGGSSCVDISPSGDGGTYAVVPADVGSTLRVRVTASNGVGSSSYASAVAADGPMSYWRFGDSGGTLADSRGFKSGAYVNGPQLGAPGLITGDADTAVSFNGTSQYADVPPDPAWTPATFSLELSVKPSVLPDNRTLWSTIDTFRGWWLNTNASGALRFFIGDGSAWQTASAGPVLSAGASHHLVATYDGTNARLYVDGVLVSTGPAVAMNRAVVNGMRFGAPSGLSGQWWPGVLDDASFYPFALSSAQVTAHYQQSVGTGTRATSNATEVVVAAPPANTSPPTISGTPQSGQTLTASTGLWSGTAPLTYAYQWRQCDGAGAACTDVGTNAPSYLLSAPDVGRTIRVVVTASNGGGSQAATSAQTAVVVAAGSSTTVTFALAASGDDGVASSSGASYPPGGAATAETSGNAVTMGRRLAHSGYEVYAGLLRFDTSTIPDDATVTAATLRVQAIAKQNGDGRNLVGEWYGATNWPIDAADYALNNSGSALAGSPLAQITVGAQNDFALSGLGSLSKTGFTGLRLHVGGGQPSGDNYVLFASFDDPTLTEPRLVVTYSTSSSPPTPPTNTSPPTISGTAQVGSTLTASPGSWSGTEPISYAYQWRRCDAGGAACSDVGTNASTYAVTSADVGRTIRVVVTATNGVGSSSYASAVAADGPTSYWRFGDSGGTLADSRGFKGGVYVNGPQLGVPGLITGDADTAVSCNGTSQYADVPADPAWTPASFSLELSVKPSVLPVNRTLWSTFDTFRGWWLNTNASGALRLFIGDGSAWQIASGPVLSAGVSHHLVATYDGTNARLYVDGALVATGPPVAMNRAVVNGMRFGAPSGLAGQYWPGVLDDASFYPFALSSAQVGAHYQQSRGSGSSATSAQTAVVVAATTAPANTSPPVISGTAQDGQTLTASTGSWTGTAPITYAYQWRQCDAGGAACGNVGTNASTYALTSADVGRTIRVIVTATNSGGSQTATSAQTAVVAAAGASSTTVTFNLAASGDDGVVSSSGAGYPPAGAATAETTASNVTMGRRLAHTGYEVYAGLLRFNTSSIPDDATVTAVTLRVQTTAKQNGDGLSLVGEWYDSSNWPIDAADYALDNSGSALTGSPLAQITVGAQNNFALTGLGSLSKTGFTGLRLHLSGGQPSGDNYLLFASFDDPTLAEPRLVVTYSNAPPPPTPPTNTSPPTISGTAQDGQTLSASTGSWSGTAPITYAYQWRQCDAGGAACGDVGTNASTYLLSAGDVGRTIRVIVTASNSEGSQAATSAQTAVVAAAGAISTTVTFNLASSGDDGFVSSSGAAYPPGGAAAAETSGNAVTVGRRRAHTGYEVYAGLLRFDTASIPDSATVTAATLQVRATAKQNEDGRNLVGEWYDAANWPIDAGDFALDSSASALAGSPLAQITVGAQNDFALTGLGSLSKTGFTGLRLHLDGGQPAGDNYLLFASFDDPSLTEPRLVVTYTQ